jgi:hypothetical protein
VIFSLTRLMGSLLLIELCFLYGNSEALVTDPRLSTSQFLVSIPTMQSPESKRIVKKSSGDVLDD